MQTTETGFRNRNKAEKSSAEKSQDIYFLTKNLPRQTSRHYHEFDYDHTLLYAEYLIRFLEDYEKTSILDLTKEEYFEKDSLIKAVIELEGKMYYHHINREMFVEFKLLEVGVKQDVFQATLFNLDMEFIDYDLPENLKIGIAYMYDHILSYFNWNIRDKDFSRDYYHTIVEMNDDWLSEGGEIDNDKELNRFMKAVEKQVKKFHKFFKKQFDLSKQYDNPVFNKIHTSIVNILRFDMQNISNLYFFDNDDNSLEIYQLFYPEFSGLTEYGDKVCTCHSEMLSDTGNNVGQQALALMYTIDQDKIYTENEQDLESVIKFENDLTDYLKTLNNYYYEQTKGSNSNL